MGRTLISSGAQLTDGAEWDLLTLPKACDIRLAGLAEPLAALRPDAVLHLAALTSVADSFRAADNFFDVNFNGTLNLLRSLRSARFTGRLLYVSSGECYGAVEADALPIAETFPLRPRSPYAVSKVAAEALCYQWSQTEGMDIVIARPFNHIGPGQDARFAVAAFAEQVARIAAGAAPPEVVTGDLDVTRDFTDVRDVISAYFALLARGRTGEIYNIASGRETRLGDLLSMLFDLAGVEARSVTDPARIRATEQKRVRADVAKIRRDTGWEPRIALSESLRSTLEYWNNKR